MIEGVISINEAFDIIEVDEVAKEVYIIFIGQNYFTLNI